MINGADAKGAAIGTEPFRGTRASANTSGPDFNQALGPVKLRSKDSAPSKKNSFLLPDRFGKANLPESRSSRLT